MRNFRHIAFVIAAVILSLNYAQSSIMSSALLPVYFKDMDGVSNGEQWRRLAFKIYNNSEKDVDISQIKFKYTIQENRRDLTAAVWYYSVHSGDRSNQGGNTNEINACFNYQSARKNLCDLVLYFKPRIIPKNGVAEFQIGIRNSTYSSVNETNDPSYILCTDYVDNSKVSLEIITDENRDSDEDGVPDVAETAIGQNPFSADESQFVLHQSKWTSSGTQTDTVVYTSPYNTEIKAFLPAGSNNGSSLPVMVINKLGNPGAVLSRGDKPLYSIRVHSNLRTGISIVYPLFVPPQHNLQGYESSACYSIYFKPTGDSTWQKVAVDSLVNGAVYFKSSLLAGDYIVTYNPDRVVYVNEMIVGGDGTSWQKAYSDLQQAITKANQILAGTSSDVCVDIFVAKGIYHPSRTGDRTAFFNIPGRVHLYGGFAGDGTQHRDWTINKTVLSGDLDDDGLDDDDSYHVLEHIRPNEGMMKIATILDGFSIEGGNANKNPPAYSGENDGAGLYIWDGYGGLKMTIKNCVFKNNSSLGTGGGIYVYNNSFYGYLFICDCLFENNKAAQGAGLALPVDNVNNGGAVKTYLQNCTFSNNRCIDGGLYLDDNNQLSRTKGGALFLSGWNTVQASIRTH